MFALKINGKTIDVDAEPDTPLLWVLRDTLGLTGTKYGCGAGLCGACTGHVNGQAVKSCLTPAQEIEGKRVVTIEGLSPDGCPPLQKAWIAGQGAQCGYWQSGQSTKAGERPRSN